MFNTWHEAVIKKSWGVTTSVNMEDGGDVTFTLYGGAPDGYDERYVEVTLEQLERLVRIGRAMQATEKK